MVLPLPSSLSRAKRWRERRDPLERVPTLSALRGITLSLENMGNDEIMVLLQKMVSPLPLKFMRDLNKLKDCDIVVISIDLHVIKL